MNGEYCVCISDTITEWREGTGAAAVLLLQEEEEEEEVGRSLSIMTE